MNDEQLINVALAHYNSARQELIERLRLRDQALFLFTALVAAIYGVALEFSSNALLILLMNPFLCVGFAGVISSHSDCKVVLARYCTGEVFDNEVFENAPKPYNSSDAMSAYSRVASLDRELSYFIGVIFASVPALYLTFPVLELNITSVLWVSAAAAFVTSFILLVRAHRYATHYGRGLKKPIEGKKT